MKNVIVASLVIIFLSATGSLRAFHDGDHSEGPMDTIFKVNKKGEVNIETDVKLGTYLVKRGKYMLTHQIKGERHSFILDEINKKKQPAELTRYELASQFLAHPTPVTNSILSVVELGDHTLAVAKIQVAGEYGDHVFPAGSSTNIRPENWQR